MIDLRQGDCLELMKDIPENSIDLVLTDIPYGEVNRDSNGLRKLSKENADILTFDLTDFLDELHRICKGTIIVFCGQRQYSTVHSYFYTLQEKSKGTVRQLVWQKTNPSPMNGEYIYLSGIENAVWFKKKGGTFNARCKNTVFKYPCGRSKCHPTEKNHNLLKELILDNSNEGDTILDPCMGSGSHGIVALENNRHFIGIELDTNYFTITQERIAEAQNKKELQDKWGYNPYQE